MELVNKVVVIFDNFRLSLFFNKIVKNFVRKILLDRIDGCEIKVDIRKLMFVIEIKLKIYFCL